MLAAWRDGKTGYPWIDAIMVQVCFWSLVNYFSFPCMNLSVICNL